MCTHIRVHSNFESYLPLFKIAMHTYMYEHKGSLSLSLPDSKSLCTHICIHIRALSLSVSLIQNRDANTYVYTQRLYLTLSLFAKSRCTHICMNIRALSLCLSMIRYKIVMHTYMHKNKGSLAFPLPFQDRDAHIYISHIHI